MVSRAGFKSFGFPLRAEPATSLSRYGLTTESFTWECIDVVWLDLFTWIGTEMVGRAGFEPATN